MDFLSLFHQYLQDKEKNLSKVTTKNYKADIRHFCLWFEKQFNKPFSPQDTSVEIIEIYKKSDTLTPRSMKRHMSSLKKFFCFLQREGHSDINPFDLQKKTSEIHAVDKWHIKAFKNYLYIHNASNLTIKNYIIDIQQFLRWLEKVTGVENAWDMREKNLFEKIGMAILEEYKERLFKTGFSARSINRKLSSLRKYIAWAQGEGLITKKSPFAASNAALADLISLTSLRIDWPDNLKQSQYSRFPPFRLIQKITKATDRALDAIFIMPLAEAMQQTETLIWRMKGRQLFKDFSDYSSRPIRQAQGWQARTIQNIPKSLYAPLAISTKYFSLHKKLLYHLNHSRPEWYKKYHTYPIVHFVHFAILFLFVSFLGFSFSRNLFGESKTNQAVLGITKNIFSSPQTLSFQGRLTDSSNNPVIKTSQVRFALYNSSASFGNALLWEETQTITPNQEGIFKAMLGKQKTIPESIFLQTSPLYLGITVGTDEELTPRQQVPTVSYAAGAETLQGLPLITQANAPENNVILALDSGGNLSMAGSAPHTIQATGGQLAVSGEKLLLATNPGSNGNIQLVPDGSGKIDLQKPIHNSTNNNNIPSASGALEVDDLFAILATSSAQSAFTLNQNGGGPLISASSSGAAKFTVQNDGSTYVAGNMGIGVATPIAKLQVAGTVSPGATNTYDLGSPSLYWNTLYVNTVISPSSGTFGYFQRTSSSISPTNITDALNLGATASSSATVHLAGTSGDNSFIKTGNVGIGTQTANARLQIQGLGTTTGMSLVTTNSEGIQQFSVLDNGNVGIGTSSPNYKLEVLGSAHIAGTIYATNTTVQSADLAENYISSQILEPGDVVIAANDGNTLAVVKSTVPNQQQTIGVVSTKPGVTLNADAKPDTHHPNLYPIGLSGRVPVKVSNENGPISVGDYLTSSPIPGVAMKATKPGIVIGKALEPFDGTQETKGKIMIFVNLSWYDGGLDNVIAITAKTIAQTAATIQQITTNILNANKIISPIAQIDEIHTHIISPLSPDTDVIVQLASPSATHTSKFIIKNASGSAVASIDSSGSARFAGNIQASSASISGILRANKIIADQIEGLVVYATQSAMTLPITGVDIASYSAQLAYVANLNTTFGTFTQGLMSLGPASLSDTTITGQLSIGANLILADSSINVLGSDLQIQPLRQGGISFLSGLVSIDTNGNLQTQGDIVVKGKLAAGVISPLPDSDLVIQLPDVMVSSHSAQNDKKGKLVIQNASGSAVLSINSIGDLIASGAATVKKLNIQLVQDAIALSDIEVIASGSAGVATISAQRSTLTIDNPLVTDKSLIYITPRTETDNQVMYLLRQIPNISFTVGIQQPAKKDTPFNWLLVN